MNCIYLRSFPGLHLWTKWRSLAREPVWQVKSRDRIPPTKRSVNSDSDLVNKSGSTALHITCWINTGMEVFCFLFSSPLHLFLLGINSQGFFLRNFPVMSSLLFCRSVGLLAFFYDQILVALSVERLHEQRWGAAVGGPHPAHSPARLCLHSKGGRVGGGVIPHETTYIECLPCPLFDILLNKYFPAG